MEINIGQLLSYVAPAVVVVGGARWLVGVLWGRFEKKLNENRDAMLTVLGELKEGQVKDRARLDHHDERLAWLEGQAGQPLHSHRGEVVP